MFSTNVLSFVGEDITPVTYLFCLMQVVVEEEDDEPPQLSDFAGNTTKWSAAVQAWAQRQKGDKLGKTKAAGDGSKKPPKKAAVAEPPPPPNIPCGFTVPD